MPNSRPAKVISVARAQARLNSLLRKVKDQRARFVITQAGEPAGVLLGVSEFDDMVEELDPVFQQSLAVAAEQHDAGESVGLADYLKQRRRTQRRRN